MKTHHYAVHRSSLPVGTTAVVRESSNEHQTQTQQILRDHHSIERERSSSCPNIEAERQLILGKAILDYIRFTSPFFSKRIKISLKIHISLKNKRLEDGRLGRSHF